MLSFNHDDSIGLYRVMIGWTCFEYDLFAIWHMADFALADRNTILKTYCEGSYPMQERCPLDQKYGDVVCRDGWLWELTYSEMGPPDSRQATGDECPHCKKRKAKA